MCRGWGGVATGVRQGGVTWRVVFDRALRTVHMTRNGLFAVLAARQDDGYRPHCLFDVRLLQ